MNNAQNAIQFVAKHTELSHEVVHAGFLKASPERLRKIHNQIGALALFMADNNGLVTEEVDRALKMGALIAIQLGAYGDEVDLSELADEVEAATAVTH